MPGVITPPTATFLTTFRFDPVACAVIVVAAVAYGFGVVRARRNGNRWGAWPTVAFAVLGLGSYAWASFGFLGAYSTELRWAEISRFALLVFVVPWLLALGRPGALLEASLTGGALDGYHRVMEGRVLRVMGSAVFEPLFTIALFLLFLTPLAGWLWGSPVAENSATVLIPLVGLLAVLPLAEKTRRHTSFTLGAEFLLAMGALVFDAIPGIFLRLHETVIAGLHQVAGAAPAWFPTPLHDQQLAGDWIWFFAEAADIPIIIILAVRWSRIDRGEADEADALTDDEMDALSREHLERWRGARMDP